MSSRWRSCREERWFFPRPRCLWQNPGWSLGFCSPWMMLVILFSLKTSPFLKNICTGGWTKQPWADLRLYQWKCRKKRRNEQESHLPACFRRSVLVKRNYILRTRQIVSDLLSWRPAVKVKHFSVRITIAWQGLTVTRRNDPDLEKICSFVSSCCFLIAQLFLTAISSNKNKTKACVFTCMKFVI